MKGLVFTEFLEMVENHFSPEIADHIIEASDLPSGGAYTTLGTYDYTEIVQLVTHLSRETDTSPSDLIFAFGQHLFGQFVYHYPWAIDGAGSAFVFLQQVHDHIHVEVRKLYPDAELPRFDYDTSVAGQLVMHYRSKRPFADLAHGLIVGCIEHYGEAIGLVREDLSDQAETSVRFILTQQEAETPHSPAPAKANWIQPAPAEEIEPATKLTRLQRKLDREQQARKQAEDLAEEKTRELYLANQQITTLNSQLKEENVRMEAELGVTRQLQQMLLPKDEELKQVKGLDIAGYIEPASEVGGDYYDILQANGRVRIGIGDVTDHGLESSVVMLMTQMGVRTLLNAGNTSLSGVISQLNQTIYQNIQRMGVDKSMTLILLDYISTIKGGQLLVSGQHEDLIVVRKGGKIELVDTMDLGFPIGLDLDIADFMDQITIDLQPGDGVVLYTDGITEAENCAGEHYLLERLCEVITQTWSQSAEAIKETIIADVTRHIGRQIVHDDITLLVLKQK